MSDTLRASILFLIDALFSIALFILMIRLILAYVRADYLNPLVQFIVSATDWLITPLRRFIRDFKGVEMATLLVIIVLEVIKFFLIGLFSFGYGNIFGLIILAFADIIKIMVEIFFFALIVQVILSFVQQASPMYGLLARFNAPILRPFQRIIPVVGGVDISPIFACIVLQLINIIVVAPLYARGLYVAFG